MRAITRIVIISLFVILSPPSWGGGIRSLLFMPFPSLDSSLGAFTISGITGGSDSTADGVLSGTDRATVNWATSTGATSYKVKIFGDDGTTEICAEETTASLTYDFSLCGLTPSTYYRAEVIAVNGGTELAATNSTFRFWVTPGNTNVLGNAVPAVPSTVDGSGVEVGVKFQSSCDGKVIGVRFYRATAQGAPYYATLWSSGGTNLSFGSTLDAALPGWNQVIFSSPVTIAKNTTYVASYHATTGYYASESNYFTSSVTNGCLTMPSSASSGGNGVFKYNSVAIFPDETFNATNQ